MKYLEQQPIKSFLLRLFTGEDIIESLIAFCKHHPKIGAGSIQGIGGMDFRQPSQLAGTWLHPVSPTHQRRRRLRSIHYHFVSSHERPPARFWRPHGLHHVTQCGYYLWAEIVFSCLRRLVLRFQDQLHRVQLNTAAADQFFFFWFLFFPDVYLSFLLKYYHYCRLPCPV